jgi:hypothetical protein
MRTLSCNLKWSDGVILTVTAESESAETEVPVKYSGALDRMPSRYEKADLGFLEWWLKTMATKTGAEIDLKTDGEFTRWAE